MIYLNAEVVSGLGEDTFWTWFRREFPNSTFDVPSSLNDDDVVLRYSTLGHLPIEGKQIALCWELYPAMRDRFGSDEWNPKIARVHECAEHASWRTVASDLTVGEYARYGEVDIIPIGVDTELFRPMYERGALRAKYGLPQDKRIGLWIGTAHPMKGYDLLLAYAAENPDVHWVTICKTEQEKVLMPNASAFVHIPQEQSAELLNAADFFLSTSRLRPYYMAEWEAMACDRPMVLIGDTPKEFEPSGNPRNDVMARHWDRHSVKRRWTHYLEERGVRW